MSNRVSLEQRRKLLEFMQGHEDLARGRVLGADAARHKKTLLSQLAAQLNSVGSGATKTPEKWLKCWQDWKSDVKSKYLKIKKARNSTGGGPSPAPLTALEEDLLQFFGIEMVEGLPGVADPLMAAEDASPSPEMEIEQETPQPCVEAENISANDPPEPSEVPTASQSNRRHKNDPLQGVLERQAAAIEDVAAASREIAAALRKIYLLMCYVLPTTVIALRRQ